MKNELRTLIDDGQRAYRLKKEIGDCPAFDNPIHKKAWKAGYRSAIHRKSVEVALTNFLTLNSDMIK